MVLEGALRDVALTAAGSVVAALVVKRARLPAVAGLLLAGTVLGPPGLGLVGDESVIQALSEVGVVMLLFTIGLEFSLTRLRRIARLVVLGGTLQVGLTLAVTAGAALALGLTPARATFFGFVIALSSTAIVMRGLSERGELDAPHGRIIVGALIFQDLLVVPLMLVLPALAGADGAGAVSIAWALVKALGLVAAVLAVGRFVVPRVFARVDASRSREVFVLAVLAVCAGTAFLAAHVGLSLALGAFVAGILLADTEFGHRALGEVLALRDVFTSLFFVSIGMLLDARVILERPLVVLGLVAGMLFGKALVATASALVMRFPLRIAVLSGIGLAQFGEFGFVLMTAGHELGLVTAGEVRLVLTAGVITMFVTPLAALAAPRVAAGAAGLRGLSELLGTEDVSEPSPDREKIHDHVVIAGFGAAGRMLADALGVNGVPYLVLDVNSETVRVAAAQGLPVYYGDASSAEALGHARLDRARALVLFVNDPAAAKRALGAARQVAPNIPILVRTRYVADRPQLRELGATEVVCEEAEAGFRVLQLLLPGTIAPALHAVTLDAARGRFVDRTVPPVPRLTSERERD